MLSYRHHFHAGNFADVHKHFLLYHCLNYFNRKPKPYLYLDTHGGAGLYDTAGAGGQKTGEAAAGFQRLLQAQKLPEPVQEFADFLQTAAQPPLYPGSPLIAAKLLRRNDTLRSCELHPGDYPLLSDNIRRVRPRHSLIQQTDGYKSIAAALPPPQHRALVLIDPPYEEKQDYQRVIRALEGIFKRFRPAAVLVWYPLLQRLESRQLPQELLETAAKFDLDYLDSQLTVKAPSADGFGMHGSGMMIFNPPYILPDILKDSEDALTACLGQDETAGHAAASHIR